MRRNLAGDADQFPADVVEAVLAAGFDDVVDARQRLQALAQPVHVAAVGGEDDFQRSRAETRAEGFKGHFIVDGNKHGEIIHEALML